ncbi:MAG: protein kinase/lanthionine synthetase C family protein, partial [Micrococcales bacterium]|nr:protein kinase/lanthionine synthetase C family protein [Micrococcales bacterium]
NAGGVYEAVDRDGVTVVLKEGRPNAGLTPDGRDAASRISDEEATLRVLAGPNVVAVRDAFALHGHRFLVLEHVNGRTLSTEVVRRTPAIRADAITADRLAYRQWALGIAGRVEQAVARIHAAGYAHGDLHPGNIVVTPDDDVVLLDFEVASPAKEHASALIGAPGFVVADRRGGLAADRYALACLRIFLFCPLTPLLELDPLKADDILAFIRDTYGLSDDLIDSVRAGLGLPVPPTGPESHLAETVDHAVRMWDMHSQDAVTTLQTMIVRSLGATADYTRDDRIWPGDPRQFSENSYSLAHGAAGVIHALDVVGQEADRRSFDRLNVATGGAIPRAFERVGLFDGLAGVGWLHRRHGHDDLADAVLARIRSTDLNTLGSDLYGGLPGVGLYLLGEAEHHPELVDDARTIASRLCARRVRRTPPDPNDLVPTVRTDHGGLMWGSSGTALFALRLYERTGDPAYLNLAVETVDDDLAHCLVAADGSLQVNEGWRLVPYLATGSVGIGLVLAQLLPHLDNPARYQQALTQITAAVCAPFTIEPGLFYGRAGMIHFLVVLARLGLSTPATEAVLVAHVEGLKLHALRHHGGIGFPGRGLLRMSCDLATGSAGILAALQAYSSLTFDPGRPGWEDTLPHLLTGSTSVPITPEQRPCGKGGDMPWGSSSSSKPLNTMRTQIATLT